MGGFRRSTKCQNYDAQQEQGSARVVVAIKSKSPKHIRTILLDLMEDVSGKSTNFGSSFLFLVFY